jgi:hypothetical protein
VRRYIIAKILFVSKVNTEFVSHGLSNLLLGKKTVRVAKGDAPNSFEKSGKTAWAVLLQAPNKIK